MRQAMMALAVCTLAASTQAAVFTFTHTGTGSGTLGGTPFANRAFTITSTGDTSARVDFGNLFYIPHTSSRIDIDGLGSVQVLTATRTFATTFNSPGLVGYALADPFNYDLFDGPTSPALASWTMTTSIGPLSGSGSLLQWGFLPVQTDQGVLFFNNGTTAATFQATLVPLPGAAGLLAIGGTVVARRRRSPVGKAVTPRA